ncbi:transcription antitermination factor NusB [Marinifilum sp. D714]|uniref:transcription antitermination factor NusB n=1 Tax=Marinifilum sp. D714 TaxID=2937523 RepID=UPI0027D06B81|nr:transcription antitermination factor NusB [Marinifilum sp. D714]MDQ2177215.1 transcription antitermination factor NusB [Marinifilum sp. D714]
MISRRLLRVKVLQLLYAYYKNQDRTIAKAEKELFFSIGKAYDLYHYLLLLIVELAFVSEKKIETAKAKIIPTQEDLNPNTRFIDNKVIRQLAENIQLNSYAESNTITWTDQEDYIRLLFDKLVNSDLYIDYMNAENNSYQDDKKFVEKFFLTLVAADEDFYSLMEEKSIYWNDEIEFIISMVIKTVKGLKENDDQYTSIMSLFKDDEDEDYVKTLFRKAVVNHTEHVEMIQKNTKNWDLERIAFMDILIMELALTELKEFPNVPVKVSFNEYLEIAKFYSTSNSSNFINGILDKLVKELKENGKVKKVGRGLVGEV